MSIRTPRTLVAAVAATAVLLVVVPASAFHCGFLPCPPLLSTTAINGNGGVSQRISLPAGSAMDLEIQGNATGATSYGFGVFLYNAAGQIVAGFMFTATGNQTEVHVEGPVVGELVDVRSGAGGGFTGAAMGLTNMPAGTYVAVLGGTTDGSFAGEANVYASAGSSIVNTTTGGGFMHREADFSGGVNVIASVGPTPVRAKVLLGDTVSETISNSLFGWFGAHFFDAVYSAHYTGPNGGGSGTTHYFFFGTQAGTYNYTIDANIGLTSLQGAWAWGLDIALA